MHQANSVESESGELTVLASVSNVPHGIAIDTQANLNVVNDISAFEPGLYHPFSQVAEKEKQAVRELNGTSHAEGSGVAVFKLMSDDGTTYVIRAPNTFYKPGFTTNLLSAVKLMNFGVEVERNMSALILPGGDRIPLKRLNNLLFADGRIKLHVRSPKPQSVPPSVEVSVNETIFSISSNGEKSTRVQAMPVSTAPSTVSREPSSTQPSASSEVDVSDESSQLELWEQEALQVYSITLERSQNVEVKSINE